MNKAFIILSLVLGSSLQAANKPRYTATQVFQKMLQAQESQLALSAKVWKDDRDPARPKAAASVSGTLRTLPGGLARLDLTWPKQGLVLSDGKALWVELPEVKQVMKYDAKRMRDSGNFFMDLASSIQHYAKASLKRLVLVGPDFDASKVTALQMDPDDPRKAGFESLRVWVDHQRWVILRVALVHGGTETIIRFENIKIQRKGVPLLKDGSSLGKDELSPELFKYTPPKGYETFDLDI